jgi:hypothetical protein
VQRSVIITSILMAAAALSCSSPTEPNPYDFHYPLSVGNEWVYSVTMTKDFDDDSPDELFAELTSGIIVSDSTGVAPSGNLYDLVEFEGSEWSGTKSVWSRYLDLDTALYRTESFNVSGMITQPKLSTSHGFRVGHKSFNSMPELVRYYTGGLISGNLAADVSDDAPVVVLRYPLKEKLTWVYRRMAFDSETTIYKLVAGMDSVTVAAGEFSCVRIEWDYVGDVENVTITDYLAPEGLILRRATVSGIEEQTYSDPFGTGRTYTMVIEYALESLTASPI